MPVNVKCIQCGKAQQIIPARAVTYKFCSVRCRSDWRKVNFRGENNPKWRDAIKDVKCGACGNVFRSYRHKFCSKPCADKGGFRYNGEAHPNWRGGRKKRSKGYKQWTVAVISRDKATCTKCGTSNVELHAHHLKSWKDYPELRLDVANGITVCARCHWDIHSASNENGVKSGKLPPGKAGDNPEPSRIGNVSEGVTTRGRAYRRWSGHCETCGAFISKRLSDVHAHNFCGHRCAGKYRVAKNITTFGRQ